MTEKDESMGAYMHRGLDAVLRLGSKAGDSLRVASNRAIEKLDTYQLEKKYNLLLRALGRHAYEILSGGGTVHQEEGDTAQLVTELTDIEAEIQRRMGTERFSESNKKTTKNTEAY